MLMKLPIGTTSAGSSKNYLYFTVFSAGMTAWRLNSELPGCWATPLAQATWFGQASSA
jgi:hypothetical protein